ncbi:hypothetical protein ES708_29290 [subsurface metagenome]
MITIPEWYFVVYTFVSLICGIAIGFSISIGLNFIRNLNEIAKKLEEVQQKGNKIVKTLESEDK